MGVFVTGKGRGRSAYWPSDSNAAAPEWTQRKGSTECWAGKGRWWHLGHNVTLKDFSTELVKTHKSRCDVPLTEGSTLQTRETKLTQVKKKKKGRCRS